MPAVSIIVPVYNVEPYMARCVRSLFGQTLQDVEYIFVDDCTPDRSIEVMRQVLEEEFPDRIPQVKVFRMPRNSGQAKVRMQGLALATGDYIIHCDSDDEVAVPDAYGRLYEKAVREDLDIVVCNFFLMKDGGQEIRSLFAPAGKEVKSILTGKTMGSLCCRMFRRSILEGIEPAVGDMTEDLVIAVQAACNAKRIGYLEEPLYRYYLRSSSVSVCPGIQSDLSRWRSSYANARVLIKVLTDRYGYREKDPAIVYYKYRHRMSLKSYVKIPEYYQKWKSTFPEIDRYFLLTPGIPLKEKYRYLLIRLGL